MGNFIIRRFIDLEIDTNRQLDHPGCGIHGWVMDTIFILIEITAVTSQIRIFYNSCVCSSGLSIHPVLVQAVQKIVNG